MQVAMIALAQATRTDPKVVSIDLAVEVVSVIWIVKLRTGRAVNFRANGSKASKAAASIDLGAVEDLAVIDLVAVDSEAGVIALAAADLEGLAGSVAAAGGSEVGAEN